MRYVIYCDELGDKGRYYSNFYGGALLLESNRNLIEGRIAAVKAAGDLGGEMKWTKISEYNEDAYIAVVDEAFKIISEGLMKVRIMFTQNINQTKHIEYEEENAYFMLYYQFVKHAFGLTFCNNPPDAPVTVAILLDDVPHKRGDFDNFKNYMSSLSQYPFFYKNKIQIAKTDIADVESCDHLILQVVDIILGSMHFRLNDLHKAIPVGQKRRGKRTRAKERVYKQVNARIRDLYPHFNIGVSTGALNGPVDRWHHAYRHWCFVPKGSKVDLDRGKGK